MLIGYARVSTQEQNLDLQEDALRKAGCEKIITDKISGKTTTEERPGLSRLLEIVREGDTVVVWKLDRLGRSLPHLLEMIRAFEQLKVEFRSLNENIDTSGPAGKLIFHIFASLCEFERDLIRSRTQAGLEAARARGRFGGRPRKLDDKKAALANKLYKERNHTVKEICQMLEISKPTFYQYVKR